ncbi:SRPBCC family protein [Tellurirhabdus rosea]|uniref:SRPBCC family protein n=1 Tax=Tellurirhabdus rosea TaxID=2674997 RepID=UPI00225304CF|nr:SRPBCC family protein [Tellurirhabdus rosea]
MNTPAKETVSVEVTIQAPVEKVWERWTSPEHIVNWNHASDDWHTPRAENDLREGGKFIYRMEAKDGSVAFDFVGTYEAVRPQESLVYILEDDRRVTVTFAGEGETTRVTEAFEADSSHPVEMQQTGWQAILDNFKKYVESQS